ncbi:MAG: hypothetical protein EPO12_19010 [Aquabacterium sp.]|jgi:hypothetical protein|nr:MAG: hypothetical protein EPO12_19010 [Aquabacterium sp.]
MQRHIPIGLLACLLASPAARADSVSARLENISFGFAAADGSPVPGSPGSSYADALAHFDDGSSCGTDPYPWPSGCSGADVHLPGVDLEGSWSTTQVGPLQGTATVTRPGTAYDFLLYQYTFATVDDWQDAIVLDPGTSVTLTADFGASFDDGATASGYALAVGLLSLRDALQPDERIDSLTLAPGDAPGRLSVTYTNETDHRIGVSWEAQLEIHGITAAVPEPGMAGLLVLGAALLAVRRAPA